MLNNQPSTQMKKTLSLLLLLGAFNSNISAQKTADLIGKWEFSDIEDKSKLDAEGLAMMHDFFDDMTLIFFENGRYSEYLKEDFPGTWTFNETTSEITKTADKGTISTVQVTSLTPEELHISLGPGKVFIFKRTQVTNPELAHAAASTVQPTYTESQLAKNWVFKSRTKPETTEEVLELVNQLAQGAYFHFKTSGDYEAMALGIEGSGKWRLENGKIMLKDSAGGQRFWTIKSVSITELEIAKGNTEEIWTFSTQ